MSKKITIVDVAPRDGLQNEEKILPSAARVELVNRIEKTGVSRIEIGSFVNPRQVPQMEGMEVLCRQLNVSQKDGYTALVPNLKGYEYASRAGMRHIRLAILASDSLNQANFHCTTETSFKNFRNIVQQATTDGIAFGSIIGASFGCPYEGMVDKQKVLELVKKMADLGADEIVLADTTGMAVPDQVASLCYRMAEQLSIAHPKISLGVHLHNTRNTGYANAYAAVKAGINCFDSSLGGIGGCPFTPRAVGNIATEDLVHMLNGLGYDTHADMKALLDASAWLSKKLEKELPALVGKAEPVYSSRNTLTWDR
jgi:(R)-citramalyl-CoA lyase